jgi:para-aminobenzoate synthetase component 1
MPIGVSSTHVALRCDEVSLPLPAAAAFERLCREPRVFFLDSAQGYGRLGRFSFLGAKPFGTLTSREGTTRLAVGGRSRTLAGSPFAALREVLRRFSMPEAETPVPFACGAVGFLSYDLKNFVERLPSRARRDLDVPDMHFAFHDATLAFDHETGRTVLSSAGSALSRRVRTRRAVDAGTRLLGLLDRAPAPRIAVPRADASLESNFTRDDYVAMVRRAREYILAGDIFQVNLSQRFHAHSVESAPELYLRLRDVNPAPFAAYLDFPGGVVLSSSPERFLNVAGRHVETRPIKGTRRRTGEAEPDRAAAEQLLASAKDNAELAMIVDLERNDLGRVCEYGSVRVTEPCVLETYPTVFHLVATVEGRLHERHDLVDLLRSTFPGGSITGAPKIRAMEIIDELEPTARGVYTGNLGWIDFRGRADFNILIRTMLKLGDDVYFQAGGGIVSDSEPEAEYEETIDKARALMRAVGAE